MEALDVAFSRDGSRILPASYDRMRIWMWAEDARAVADVVAFVEKHAPWGLVGGRLKLVGPGPRQGSVGVAMILRKRGVAIATFLIASWLAGE